MFPITSSVRTLAILVSPLATAASLASRAICAISSRVLAPNTLRGAVCCAVFAAANAAVSSAAALAAARAVLPAAACAAAFCAAVVAVSAAILAAVCAASLAASSAVSLAAVFAADVTAASAPDLTKPPGPATQVIGSKITSPKKPMLLLTHLPFPPSEFGSTIFPIKSP